MEPSTVGNEYVTDFDKLSYETSHEVFRDVLMQYHWARCYAPRLLSFVFHSVRVKFTSDTRCLREIGWRPRSVEYQ